MNAPAMPKIPLPLFLAKEPADEAKMHSSRHPNASHKFEIR
jgi:hypothetical protein